MLSCSRGRQYQPRLLCSFASAEFNLANFSVGCVLNRWSPAAKEIRSPLRTRSRPVVPGRARWQPSFLENDTKSGENHASSRRVPSTQLPAEGVDIERHLSVGGVGAMAEFIRIRESWY